MWQNVVHARRACKRGGILSFFPAKDKVNNNKEEFTGLFLVTKPALLLYVFLTIQPNIEG